MSEVYVKVNEQNYIVAIDGGYTKSNIQDINDWILIDKGEGEKYNFCQTHYLGSLISPLGVYYYKLIDNKPIRRPTEEIIAEEKALNESEFKEISLNSRIQHLEETDADIILMMADLIGGE